MDSLYKNLSQEEQKMSLAIDDYHAAQKDEHQALLAFTGLYAVGIFLAIVSPNNSQGKRLGNALIVCALIMVGVHVLLAFRTRRYRRAAKALTDPYLRKKALPFYHELLELFRHKPDVHLHLEADGKITVTDKRKAGK